MSALVTHAERIFRADVGDRIKRLRGSRSQESIAKHVGITQAAFSNYERGIRDMTLSTAVAVAHELDVSIGELVGAAEVRS